MLYAAIIVAAALVLGVILLFNSLVGARQFVRNAWSDVDVYLRRRADLIPNLVEAVKAYADHERTVLEAVTEARVGASVLTKSPLERAAAEQKLGTSLVRVMALAESYPELKANANFLDLQKELSETETKIASARQYYNACVRDFNIKLESFPSSLAATLGGFKHAEFFELADPSEAEAPKVST